MEAIKNVPKLMSRLLLSAILAVSFMPCIPWAQNIAQADEGDTTTKTIVVGEDTTTHYQIPYGCDEYYSLAEMIYTASEIKEAGGDVGYINSLAFNVANASALSGGTIKIYLGTTSATMLDRKVDASALTQVYSGKRAIGTETGWEIIDFDTPYLWNGTGNLLVAVSRADSAYTNSLRYYVNRGTSWARSGCDTSAYADITNSSYYVTSYDCRPNVQFSITESSDPVATVCALDATSYQVGTTLSASVDTSKTHYGRDVDTSKVTNESYQWKYTVDGGDPISIDGATSAGIDFEVPNVAACSEISLYCTYSCTFDGVAKTIESNSAKFMVLSTTPAAQPAPTIDASQSVVLQNGTPATLTSSTGLEGKTEGVGDITYQWYKADSANGDFTAINYATRKTYTTPTNASVGDVYYKVEVTNTFEKAKVATGSATVKITTDESDYKVIGTGTLVSSYAPFYADYCNSLTEMLYTADEIKAVNGGATLIRELAFRVADADPITSNNIKIYIGTTSATILAAQVDASTLKLVYSGENVTIGKNVGWETYTLSEPYKWDGTSSLVIVCSRTGGCNDNLAYYASTCSNVRAWVRASDDDATYADPSKTIEDDGSMPFPCRPNVRLTMDKVVEKPAAATDLVYNSTEQTGVEAGKGYTLSGTTAATEAGTYTATAKLKTGYAWADGSLDDVTLSWSIGKAIYDISGITFANDNTTYDGKIHSLAISGTLPDGVIVAYTGNNQVGAGIHEVIASFTGDATNYEAIPSMKATLTIAKAAQTKAKIATAKKTVKGCKKGKLKKARSFKLKRAGVLGGAKVTFKKANKAGKGKIAVTKAGKVKLKKGLKKGTYKVKVRMTVAACANYGAKTVTKTIKVRVK